MQHPDYVRMPDETAVRTPTVKHYRRTHRNVLRQARRQANLAYLREKLIEFPKSIPPEIAARHLMHSKKPEHLDRLMEEYVNRQQAVPESIKQTGRRMFRDWLRGFLERRRKVESKVERKRQKAARRITRRSLA